MGWRRGPRQCLAGDNGQGGMGGTTTSLKGDGLSVCALQSPARQIKMLICKMQ